MLRSSIDPSTLPPPIDFPELWNSGRHFSPIPDPNEEENQLATLALQVSASLLSSPSFIHAPGHDVTTQNWINKGSAWSLEDRPEKESENLKRAREVKSLFPAELLVRKSKKMRKKLSEFGRFAKSGTSSYFDPTLEGGPPSHLLFKNDKSSESSVSEQSLDDVEDEEDQFSDDNEWKKFDDDEGIADYEIGES